MPNLTPEGLRAITDIASRHGVSLQAATALLDSLAYGNGYQAQFNHPELGGMGQWSQGGMIMIGDMFNQGLKYRVDGLCNELSGLLRAQPSIHAPTGNWQLQGQGGVSLFVEGAGSSNHWWPAELGDPASQGAQNDLRYAFFPGSRRIAIQQGGRVRVYDSGEHRLSGFSQQQGGDQSLTFTGQFGVVRVADLPEVLAGGGRQEAPAAPGPVPPAPVAPPAAPETWNSPVPSATTNVAAVSASPTASAPTRPPPLDEILGIIEGLAGLRQKNILTEEEFAAKKAELLGRL